MAAPREPCDEIGWPDGLTLAPGQPRAVLVTVTSTAPRQPRPRPRRPRRRPAGAGARRSRDQADDRRRRHPRPGRRAGACRGTRWCWASGVARPRRRSPAAAHARPARGAAGARAARAGALSDRGRRGRRRASGVALLGLTRGAPWAQLAAMLRSLLAEGDVGDAGPESLGGMPVRRPVRGRQRGRRAARRAGHDRGPQLAGARLLRPPGRGRPVPRRDDPRPPGAGAVRADAHRARRVPRPATAATSRSYIDPSAARAETASRARASRSPCAPATRCSARSGPRCASRSAPSARAALLRRRQAGRAAPAADPGRRRRAAPAAHRPGAAPRWKAVPGRARRCDRLGLADQPVVVLALAVAEPAERRPARRRPGHAPVGDPAPRCAAAPVRCTWRTRLIPVVPSGAGGATSPAEGADGRRRAARGADRHRLPRPGRRPVPRR